MPTIPFKEHPIVEAAQKNIDYKACKEAFDNGGFICAFAPKLKIRDCYEKNLKGGQILIQPYQFVFAIY